jgi:phage tail sheath protein FI
MAQFLSPGVYVLEVPSSAKPIAGVSTSTPGFIAVVPDKVHLVAKDTPDPATGAPRKKFVDFVLGSATTKTAVAKTPYLVTNFSQFAALFGDLVGDPAAAASTDAPVAPATSLATDVGQQQLAQAVFGFFNNGGSRCFVMRVAADTDIASGLKEFAAIDEIALVAAPGRVDTVTYDALVTHCALTKDRFAILDGPSDANLATFPSVTEAPGNTDLAAWYFPWIKVFDPATKLLHPTGDGLVAVPPSGHIAGIYARVDTDVGVHKAPANEVIRGALGVSRALSKADQDGLNPKGVNCIRVLNGNILVWGARTVGGDANADLKYINVRRTLLFLEESIDEGTQFVVFQPNTPQLWAKIVRNVGAFLTNVWRAGALFGTTPQEAFYVKCDAELNPASVRDLGQVITEVGVAIVRPAEFVIFRVSQFTAPG